MLQVLFVSKSESAHRAVFFINEKYDSTLFFAGYTRSQALDAVREVVSDLESEGKIPAGSAEIISDDLS